jgi:hypothetical protein
MSSTSSAALADSVSDSKEPGCAPSPSAKSIRSLGPSSQPTGRQFPVTKTREQSPASTQTLFAEGFLVRTSAKQTSPVEALQANVALYHTLKAERAQSSAALANHDYAMAGLVKLCLERMAL